MPEPRIALIADAHLGYAWAQRRRGQLGPVDDGGARRKLIDVLQELKPKTTVLLGDVVHAPRPDTRERVMVEETLREAAGVTHLVAVRGNHDRWFARDYAELGIEAVEHWRHGVLLALHGDREPADARDNEILIAGHLHPAVGVRDDAGHSQRIPVFLITPRAIVLPAFSPFAAGFDVGHTIPRETRALLGKHPVELVAASGQRVVQLGSLEKYRRHRANDPARAHIRGVRYYSTLPTPEEP
jgi:putative SbcD/Mre11-related phosphoesterase